MTVVYINKMPFFVNKMYQQYDGSQVTDPAMLVCWRVDVVTGVNK